MSSTNRIAELEQRNAVLEAELAALRAPKPIRVGNMILPTSADLTKLRKIVQGYYRVLTPAIDDDEHQLQFEACFRYLCSVSRTEEGKWSTYDNPTWTSRAQRWAGRDVTLAEFSCAALAHGDIQHSLIAHRFPYDLSFNLVEGGHRLPDGSGARRILDGGLLLPATPLNHPRWSCGVAAVR